jgi:hypothetical protein
MKNFILGATAVLAVVALVVSINSLFRIRSQACRDALNICVQQCDSTRDRALSENQLRRNDINFDLTRAFRDCRIENILNGEDAITQCQTEKTNAAEEELAALDRLDDAIREVRQQCVTECNNQAKKCDNRLPTRIDTTPDINVPAAIDCLEGGAPCVKPVLEICTVIAGPCDDCWKSLCGGGDWSFESSVPLEVTLIAATDPTKNARVLATSSMKGKQAVLSVPADIKLNKKERLYFGFSSKEKPGGAVKVLIHRGR